MPVRRPAPLLAVLVVAAGAVLVGSSTAGQAAPPDAPDPGAGVRVEGVGTASGAPDVLEVTVGVETGAAGVGEALDAASSAARRVLSALHDAGVDDSDVRTANVHVSPQYDGNGTDVSGYLAGQDLAVTLHDVGAAGATIRAAVEAGGDAARLQGISYAIDDDAALRASAREQAFGDARAKAEQYARLAGRTLGAVVLVQETVTPSGPVPMAVGDSAAAVEVVPIAPGATDVTVTAEVRWSFA